MNLKHLRFFQTAADRGSLNAAAAESCMSQSAASYAIQSLEKDFGCALLRRSPLGCEVTHSGSILLKRVGQLLTSIERAVDRFVQADGALSDGSRISRTLTMPQLRAIAALAADDLERSAHRLGMSSSVLRKRLRELEHSFGRPLFQRSTSNSALNTKSRALAEELAVALKELDFAKAEISSAEVGPPGPIQIGCAGMARTTLLPGVINSFVARHPQNKIKLTQDSFDRLHRRLLKGELDIIIGMERPHLDSERIVKTFLYDNDYALVCRAQHPLANQTRPSKDDLLSFDWIAPGNGPNVRRALKQLFGQSVLPNVTVETQSTATALALTLSSDRIWLSSRDTVEACGQARNLRVLPFSLTGDLGKIAMYTRTDTELPQVQREFMELVVMAARERTLARGRPSVAQAA